MANTTAENLRKQFYDETEINWMNSQDEPDIEYVWWLENKLVTPKRTGNKNHDFFQEKIDASKKQEKELHDSIRECLFFLVGLYSNAKITFPTKEVIQVKEITIGEWWRAIEKMPIDSIMDYINQIESQI